MVHCMPGGAEWVVLTFVGCFAYMLPILFGVFVIVYLVKIKTSLEKIEKRLDQLEQRRNSTE